jgi:hypothetical protein
LLGRCASDTRREAGTEHVPADFRVGGGQPQHRAQRAMPPSMKPYAFAGETSVL